jgi:hypothetical protein
MEFSLRGHRNPVKAYWVAVERVLRPQNEKLESPNMRKCRFQFWNYIYEDKSIPCNL